VQEVALCVSTPAGSGNMVTLMNKRKIFSIKGKVKMIWQIENGKKES